MPTNYIVLQRRDGSTLKLLGVNEANGPQQAIKALANGAEGKYVAVPVRNWTEADAVPKILEPQFVITEINDPFGLGEQTTLDDRDEMTVEAAQLAETHAP